MFAVNHADVAKDQFFRERISKLIFITPSHLDISEKFWNTDLWDAATYGEFCENIKIETNLLFRTQFNGPTKNTKRQAYLYFKLLQSHHMYAHF